MVKNTNAFLPALGLELDGCKAPQKIQVLVAPLLHSGLLGLPRALYLVLTNALSENEAAALTAKAIRETRTS